MRGSALAMALFVSGTLIGQEQVWNGHPFGDPKVIRGQRLFPAGTAAIDIDLDGRKDLVVGNAFSLDSPRGPMSVLALDTAYAVRRTEDCEHTREVGLVAHHSVATADVDGDGLPDLIAVSDRGSLSVHLHQGPTRDSRVHKRFAVVPGLTKLRIMAALNQDFAQFRTYGLEVDDFTGDGKLDVALCGDARIFFDSIGNTGMAVMVGDGQGGFTGELPAAIGRYIACVKSDVDLDGDADLVGLTATNEMTLARTRGAGYFTVETVSLSTPRHANRLAAGDVNGDGRRDYFVAGGEEAASLVCFFADSRGAPGQPMPIDLGLEPGQWIESMVVADMDGDELPDLATLVVHAQSQAEIVWSRNQGNGYFAAPVVIILKARIAPNDLPSYPRFLDAVDLEGDGNPELIVASCRDSQADSLVQMVLPNLSPQRQGYRYLGSGTAGDNQVEPKISVTGGGGVLGNRQFGLLLADAPIDAKVALLLHTRYDPRSIGGVRWNVFPMYAFGTSTHGTGPGAGWARLGLPLPPAPELAGYRLYFQWIVADPLAANPLGLSSTQALEVKLANR